MSGILIIDDDDVFRSALARLLESLGHVVAIASDGFEGARFCRTSPPEAVLLDMIMPYGGLETIRVLRQQFPDLPIIAMTGSDRRRLEYALAAGASEGLSKPFTREQLSAALSRALSAAPAGAG
jgi:CheY-like chemotaxis protein